MPPGTRRLTPYELCDRGDLWLRPYDNTWVETSTAHWGLPITPQNIVVRPEKKRYTAVLTNVITGIKF